MKFSNKGIANLITVSYDFSESPVIPPARWTDFLEKEDDMLGHTTEKLLSNSIMNLLSNEKRISISLSSGIDSSLCFGMIRKVFPEKKITSICGVFDEDSDESFIAKKLADKFNSDFVTAKMQSIFTNMPEIISITKKPKWNTYIHLIVKK